MLIHASSPMKQDQRAVDVLDEESSVQDINDRDNLQNNISSAEYNINTQAVRVLPKPSSKNSQVTAGAILTL